MIARLAAALALFAAAPAVAEAPSRSFEVGEAKTLIVEGDIEVDVARGPASALVLIGPSADLDRVTVTVRDGQVRISKKDRLFNNRGIDVEARLTAPALAEVRAERGAMVRADVDGPAIDAVSAMGAIVTLRGACGSFSASAAMGAMIDGEALACATAKLDAAMGATVTAHAHRSVEADAAMGGSISVKGGAVQRNTVAAMGGSVNVR